MKTFGIVFLILFSAAMILWLLLMFIEFQPELKKAQNIFVEN